MPTIKVHCGRYNARMMDYIIGAYQLNKNNIPYHNRVVRINESNYKEPRAQPRIQEAQRWIRRQNSLRSQILEPDSWHQQSRGILKTLQMNS